MSHTHFVRAVCVTSRLLGRLDLGIRKFTAVCKVKEREKILQYQPTELYRCARVVSNYNNGVKNISTKRLSCLNSLKLSSMIQPM